MYSCFPQIILGFHGCDKQFGEKALSKEKNILRKSDNSYDWLGSGIYFWENNHKRASEYAKELQKFPSINKPKINDPYVIGAVINLGKCFNLLDNKYIEYLKYGYELYKTSIEATGLKMPSNKNVKNNKDKLIRKLDCAVIDFTLNYFLHSEGEEFDSVRGMFKEGDDIYPGAGFQEKNHIQISIRNPNCIKAYFRIMSPDLKYNAI